MILKVDNLCSLRTCWPYLPTFVAQVLCVSTFGLSMDLGGLLTWFVPHPILIDVHHLNI